MARAAHPSNLPRYAVPLLALASLPAMGCSFFKSLVGANTVDFEGAEVKSVGVDLRRQQKTICPREPVQMAVFIEAQLKGDKEPKRFETWQGRGHLVNKNDKIDFKELVFQSDLGRFDEEGWFTPVPDVLTSVGREFELHTILKKQPDKFSLMTHYKPDYTCLTGGGGSGSPGSSGSAGASGSSGGSGGSGSPGSNGGAGPHVEVFATMVKTKFYDRLVAIKIDGDAHDFLLFSPEQTISITATGGPGGSGGAGGAGGRGTNGSAGSPGGNGGPGGHGGNGGHGGAGGPGGTVRVMFDNRFSEIADMIKIDVSGGPGGAGGSPGPGGSGGSGGQGLNGAPSGSQGPSGASGSGGSSGAPGPKGQASTKPAKVNSQFSAMTGVTIL